MKVSVKHVSSETRWLVLYLEAQGEGEEEEIEEKKKKAFDWLSGTFIACRL